MDGKDLLSRLADAGEEAIARLAKAPGGEQLVGALNSLRDRTDELQKKVRGIDDLERRIAELEARVATLEGAKRAARRPAATSGRGSGARSRPPAAPKPTAPTVGDGSS